RCRRRRGARRGADPGALPGPPRDRARAAGSPGGLTGSFEQRSSAVAKVFDGIDERLAAFLAAQPVFFVGTAPTDVDGHVNVSPKGLDSFRVLGSHEVAYLDLNGSGAETI